MRAARTAAAAAAAGWLLAAACGSVSGRRRPEPREPDLRIWAPVVVRWATDADRSVRFAVENGTQRTLEVREPGPSGARVAIFRDAGSAQACGVEPGDAPAGEAVRLAPGDQLPIRVDLRVACRDLGPGEYRFEVGYRVPPSGGGAPVLLPTRYGTLIVEGPAG